MKQNRENSAASDKAAALKENFRIVMAASFFLLAVIIILIVAASYLGLVSFSLQNEVKLALIILAVLSLVGGFLFYKRREDDWEEPLDLSQVLSWADTLEEAACVVAHLFPIHEIHSVNGVRFERDLVPISPEQYVDEVRIIRAPYLGGGQLTLHIQEDQVSLHHGDLETLKEWNQYWKLKKEEV